MGSILGPVGTIAGTAIGGPAGGAIGGAIGSGIGTLAGGSGTTTGSTTTAQQQQPSLGGTQQQPQGLSQLLPVTPPAGTSPTWDIPGAGVGGAAAIAPFLSAIGQQQQSPLNSQPSGQQPPGQDTQSTGQDYISQLLATLSQLLGIANG